MANLHYQQFIFEDYHFDEARKTLSLHYSLDGKIRFEERYFFNFALTLADSDLLERAFFGLWLMAGISYFKTYLPPVMKLRKGGLTPAEGRFFTTVYTQGLGQFFIENNLKPHDIVHFPIDQTKKNAPLAYNGRGDLVSLGGGKDSLVSIDLLQQSGQDMATWNLGNYSFFAPLRARINQRHYAVERIFDHSIQKLPDAYNGHVPISAIWAFCGIVVALLTGRRALIVSNENSANEPTIQNYQGIAINHQYSKSLEFEEQFQTYLQTSISPDLNYFSLLRPLSELRIAQLFVARQLMSKYQDSFSSCNRNFRLKNTANQRVSWCGACPKCAFTFLIFAPFVKRQELINLFGKNLFEDLSLRATFDQILGRADQKPFECVGEIDEARLALWMAYQTGNWPELADYQPTAIAYDYRALHPHRMPAAYEQLLRAYLKQADQPKNV